MSDSSHQPVAPKASDPIVTRPRPKGLQFGLRTLFMLMAAIAVWTTYFSNRHHIAVLEAGITAMRPLAHELIVNDADKIAVVKLAELWYDENRWEISLPDGVYRLCLATREIDTDGLAPVVKSEPLAAGRHSLQLEQQEVNAGWRVTVAGDGKTLLAVEEPKPWYPGSGSTGGGLHSESAQLTPDQSVVLFRRRFTRPDGAGQVKSPSGPTEGILLWIEPNASPSRQ